MVRRPDLLLAIAIAAAVLLLQLPFRVCGPNLIDEGAILHIADEILRGRTLYTDAVHPAFPGIHYLTATVFALFGSSLESARTMMVCVFALLTGVVFLIARWFLARWGALAVVLLFLAYRVWAYPHWHMVSYSSVSVALVIAATWILGEALARPRRWLFTLAGALAAGAFFTKQDSGLAGMAALGLAILVFRHGTDGPRYGAFTAFAAGAAAVLAVATVTVIAGGFAADLVRHAIVAPFLGYRLFDYHGRPDLWPLFQQDPVLRGNAFSFFPPIILDLHWNTITQSYLFRETSMIDAALKLIYHLPWMVLVVAVLASLVRWLRATAPRGAAERREILLILLAAGFLMAFNRPHDWIHLLVLYPSTLFLGVILIARLIHGTGYLGKLLAGGTWLVVALVTAASAMLALQFYRHQSHPVPSARGVLYATSAQAPALRQLIQAVAVAAPPNAPLAAFPYHPLVNYLTARPGLTPTYAVWPADPDPNRDEKVMRRLENTPDGLVVYSPTRFPHLPEFSQYAETLFRYLVDHFAIDRVAGGDPGGFTFLVLRRENARSGHSLLGPDLEMARITVEPGDELPRDVSREERHEFAGESLWPFRPVLRMTTLPQATVAVAYGLRPVVGNKLEISYGLNPDRWMDFPPPRVRFELSVRTGTPEHALLKAEVDPQNSPKDRQWAETTVDLSPWANSSIDLVLRVTGEPGAPSRADLAGWGDPRITSTGGGM